MNDDSPYSFYWCVFQRVSHSRVYKEIFLGHLSHFSLWMCHLLSSPWKGENGCSLAAIFFLEPKPQGPLKSGTPPHQEVSFFFFPSHPFYISISAWLHFANVPTLSFGRWLPTNSLTLETLCYGLNVDLSPKSVCWNRIPSVILLRSGTFRWQLGHEGFHSHEWV